MKMLVTGGCGFIGSNFIRHWLTHHPDDSIINLDKLTYAGNIENLLDFSNNPHYQFVRGDICDRMTVDSVMREVDVVVHFAAETHVDRSIKDSTPFVTTNVLGTHTLLESALAHGKKRFHHISTDEVFGALTLDPNEKFTPTTPYAPRSPYSASKASSDHLVRAFHITYGLPITISNCSNNFGPYMFPEKFMPLAITNIIEGKKVPVYGDGLYVRDWLYVDDHCRAIELILQKGTIGKTYLVGGMTDDIANIDIIKRIIHIMGADESMIEYVPDRPGHDRRYAIDWSETRNHLGWEPQHNFDEAIRATIEWYQTHEDWWKKLKAKTQ